ncbi:hypothetical protein KAI04_04255 [Candidatus Pacearchaeota archaeon]|nr:hypothetical protein [Candidatus Pacearchaeota archaeon]
MKKTLIEKKFNLYGQKEINIGNDLYMDIDVAEAVKELKEDLQLTVNSSFDCDNQERAIAFQECIERINSIMGDFNHSPHVSSRLKGKPVTSEDIPKGCGKSIIHEYRDNERCGELFWGKIILCSKCSNQLLISSKLVDNSNEVCECGHIQKNHYGFLEECLEIGTEGQCKCKKFKPKKTEEVCECGHAEDKHREEELNQSGFCMGIGCKCKKFKPKKTEVEE